MLKSQNYLICRNIKIVFFLRKFLMFVNHINQKSFFTFCLQSIKRRRLFKIRKNLKSKNFQQYMCAKSISLCCFVLSKKSIFSLYKMSRIFYIVKFFNTLQSKFLSKFSFAWFSFTFSSFFRFSFSNSYVYCICFDYFNFNNNLFNYSRRI